MPRHILTRPVIERFLEKVHKIEGGCWIWIGGKVKGYGRLKINGKTQRVHRVSYELYKGRIPEDFCVLHECDNPSCVNPNHLRLGSHLDNMTDMKNKGRCPGSKGESNVSSKLVDFEVREIKQLLMQDKSYKEIANLYGINSSTVGLIARGKRWQHIV